MSKIKSVIQWLYNHLGDNRTKNVIIVGLLLACMFGVVAPDRATGLRDMVLSMPF